MNDFLGQTLLDRYRVEAFIDSGGMAEVYRAHDLQRNYAVAIKLLRADLAEDREIVRRFRAEAEALERLQHANIVRFYGLERDGPLLFIVMDFVEGASLRRRLFEADGPLAPAEALPIVRQIASALNYAHHEGVVHRDVKPSNVMITSDGRALLSDFGVAKLLDQGTLTGQAPGTPAYMSPEQADDAPLGPRSDLYSFGVVIYEMLSGRRPFVGDSPDAVGATLSDRLRYEQRYVLPPSPRRFNPDLPDSAAQALLRALAKNPRERYASALEMLQALERATLPSPARAAPRPRAAPVVIDDLPTIPPPAPGALAESRTPSVSGGEERSAAFVAELTARAERLNVLALNPKGTLVAAGGSGGWLGVWSVETGERRLAARARGEILSLAFKPRDNRVMSGDDSGQLNLWDLPTHGTERTINAATWTERFNAGISDIAVGPELTVVALPTEIFSGDSGVTASMRRNDIPGLVMSRIAFHPSGKLLAVGTAFGEIILLDTDTWRETHRLTDSPHAIADLAFSPNGRHIAVASGADNFVRLWDVAAGGPVQIREHSESVVRCVAFGHDGEAIATGCVDGTVWLISLTDPNEKRLLGRHAGAVSRIAFLAGQARLATAGHDGKVRLWRQANR